MKLHWNGGKLLWNYSKLLEFLKTKNIDFIPVINHYELP